MSFDKQAFDYTFCGDAITVIASKTGRSHDEIQGLVDETIASFEKPISKVKAVLSIASKFRIPLGTPAMIWQLSKQDSGQLAFSPNSEVLATGGRLRDVRTGKVILELHSFPTGIRCLAFSPLGERIVTPYSYGIGLWDVRTGDLLQVLPKDRPKWREDIASLAFSNNGTKIVAGLTAGGAWLFDVKRNEMKRLQGHSFGPCYAIFSPDGSLILTTAGDGCTQLWDATTGYKIRRKVFQNGVTSSAFSPDGTMVMTGLRDHTVSIWDPRTGKESHVLHVGAIPTAFSPMGSMVVTVWMGWMARLWDTTTRQESRILCGHTWGVSLSAFSPDGSMFITSSVDWSGDGLLIFWAV